MLVKNVLFLAIFVLVSACSRPMTVGEISYGEQVFTMGLDFELVRFSGQEDKGIEVAKKQLAAEAEQLPKSEGSRRKSDKLLSIPPSLFGAEAITIGNTIYYDAKVYSADFATSAFDSDRWLMAHELTHVWQWQNRKETGYSFTRVVSEHLEFGENVYDYTLVYGKKFTEYRFEQQGEIIECYAKLRQISPNAPLTIRHENLIRAEFPLNALLELIRADLQQAPIRLRANLEHGRCGAA